MVLTSEIIGKCEETYKCKCLLLAYALKYAQMMYNIQKQIRDVSKGLITQLTNM